MSSTLPVSAPAASDKRQKLLDIARKRMMHYGVAKTTMQDIAQDAGMAVGTIYLYFRNKDEIVLALGEACRNEQDQVVKNILDDRVLTPVEKLEQFFVAKYRYLLDFRNDTPHGKALIRYFVERFPEETPRREQRFEAAVASILRQGVEQDAYNVIDVTEAARLLRLATLGFFPPPYLDLPSFPSEFELLDVVRSMTHQWLKAPH